KIAEKKADIILWDGGNNDLPFYKPDLHIVVADALRPGQEISTFPGEANVRMADVVVINKVAEASEENVKIIEKNVRRINPKATIIRATSDIIIDNPELIKGRKAVIVEDGPTVTHGGLHFGAAYVAAKKFGAKIVDPRPYAVGYLKAVYEKYPHLKYIVPTLGYSLDQMKDFEETLNKIPAEIIISSTPFNMANIIKVNKPIIHVKYEIRELNRPTISEIIEKFLNTFKK
ncbi:MAG: GTPase, partial [Thermoprotei archaeon]